METLWGSPYITDYIHLRTGADWQVEGDGIAYRISPQSFYQVNPIQTEKLYSTALAYAGLTGEESVWDLYCGIGTISLFLAQRAKQVYGVEIVPQAIADAKENAKLNQTAVIFERSNLYEAFSGKFDVIVSNPPYIPSAEIPNLMPEVRDFEPHQALDGLEDGLYFYRKIIAGSVEYLNEDGILCLEIGCEQASAVTEMMKHFGFKDITVVQDLAGLDRVVRGHL